MSMTEASATGEACIFCGGTSYGPGPGGRLASTRRPPRCGQCGSLERHRVLRMIYTAIPDSLLGVARALQFSPDIAAPRERFQSFEVSVYGGDNALDIMQIARPDRSYDWVIANHVIEHVPDDHRALSEMARVLTREGVMQITVPTPATELETREFGFADPARQGHFRAYGSDFPRVASGSTGLNALQATAFDPATGAYDHVYFFCRRREPLLRIGRALIESRIPAILWT